VPGHSGRIVAGSFDGVPLLLLQGRVHYYEGFPIRDVVFSVRVLGRLGIRRLILTNAAGGIHPSFRPGGLMLITDHINCMGTNPLIGPPDPGLGTRFPDMSTAYDPQYMALALRTARERRVPLRKGILAAMPGPSYETPAEIRMLRKLGADAVTMSTVPEAIAAVQMGMRVLGISFISNYATGVRPHRLSHVEIEETARQFHGRFKTLVKSVAVRIAAQP
jgi:purine-nucleoside phosphorylase